MYSETPNFLPKRWDERLERYWPGRRVFLAYAAFQGSPRLAVDEVIKGAGKAEGSRRLQQSSHPLVSSFAVILKCHCGLAASLDLRAGLETLA